ncbi:MAG: type transporter [Marmoricola sp.]|nr:type transporter [Marmoricola sp.]
MRPATTLAVAARVLTQLRRDHRTVVMLLVLPCAVMALLWWMYSGTPARSGFDRSGPALLALLPFVVMFLVTSVTTLRERTSGNLERLLAMPVGRADLLLGYALAFGLVAAVQSALAVAVCVGPLDLAVVGPVWLLLVVAVVDAVLGTALGLLVSAFARTEFQAVQFMPVLVVPQILLCGLFVPRDLLPGVLARVSDVVPLSFAVEAMQEVAATTATSRVWHDVALVSAYVVAGLVLGALTLRRRTS